MIALRAVALLFLLVLAAGGPLSAQDGPRAEQRTSRPAAGVLKLLPEDAVSEKKIALPGGTLNYTATAGTLALYDQSGEQSAAVFYTAYVAKDAPPASRPLTFVFNGGPGAASAYLHLGLVGPRILPLGIDGRGAASARLVDNPETWLAFTDLVMIDPVGTGWSRAAKSDGENNFRGVRQDAETIAKVIALYVNRNSRLSSPKYLLGESYGGFRAAKVARALQREQSMGIAGIVMVSPLLEGSLVFGQGYALGAALRFPSYVAAELERKNAFSEAALKEAEEFALTEYLLTLARRPPAGEQARAFYGKVARMTGLPYDVVERTRGFVGNAIGKTRGANGGLLVSLYDGRVAVDDPFPESRSDRRADPLLDGATRAYGSAFVAYARDELGFKTEMTYALLAPGRWDWGDGSGRLGASVSDDLRVLLALDPAFRLLVTHGYSDLVTTYGVSRYVLDHLPVGGPDRVQQRNYRGGHMIYMDDASRRALTEDARKFYQPG